MQTNLRSPRQSIGTGSLYPTTRQTMCDERMNAEQVFKMLKHIDNAPGMNPLLFGDLATVVIDWHTNLEKRWLAERMRREIDNLRKQK